MNTTHIAEQFAIASTVEKISPLGAGLINDTFLVTTQGKCPDYVLQRINHNIFKDIDLLQTNILNITTHIRQKLIERCEKDIDRKVLTVVPTVNGSLYYHDESGYWRMTVYIPDTLTYDEVTQQTAMSAGRAFGEFQCMLSDIPEGKIGETIPYFHNMEYRLDGFREAVKNALPQRLEKVASLVDEIEKRAYDMCRAERLHREGLLPKRINHCDTKVNNMLFDKNGDFLCVIDLDTTMPGYVLSDFGDFIRTAGNTGAEDDADLSKVGLNMDVFKAYARGYINGAGAFLSPLERENLPYGAALLTYMQTVRFLGDYLLGDVYYKVAYPEHNRVRSEAQFKLLRSIEEHLEQMKEYICSL
ncbi:MAG: aminoglycoside phosphotransferase family protein [Flavobacteriales bacterium]|nr:aminoglycoside phosphotransferase family protein [Flavobacteriales bacterium]